MACTTNAVLAHETNDDELAHSEMLDLIYYFCEAETRDQQRYSGVVKESRNTLANPLSSPEDRTAALQDIDFYTRQTEASVENMELNRSTLSEHGFGHGTCGISL